MRSCRSSLAVLVLAMLLTSTSCGPSSPTVADTPDGMVKDVTTNLAQGKPEVLWAAMPPSYQNDLQGVISAFAAKVDAEVYDKTFAVVKKLVGVLRDKKEFILAHPMVGAILTEEREKISANWNNVVGMFETIVDSELATVKGLQSLDVGKFLRSTGARFMSHLAEVSALSEKDPYEKEFRARLVGISAKVVSVDGDTAVVEVTVPGQPPETDEFVRVEGKWLPRRLVDRWSESMEQAKQSVAEMETRFTVQQKAAMMGMLAAADTSLDELSKAKTPEEFAQKLGQLMGGLPLENIGNLMPR